MTIQIAIDGPASAGKSTIAKIIARERGYVYVDTGAMYRAVTLAAQNAQITATDSDQLKALLSRVTIRFTTRDDGNQDVFLNDLQVSDAIRSRSVANDVSAIAAQAAVREFLVAQQRDIAMTNNVVMDGRDIGTTVLPQATVKIFLVASVAERAERRYREYCDQGIPTDLATLTAEIKARDAYDSNRDISPLRPADDAICVDTTGKTIPEVVEMITTCIKKTVSPVKG